MRKKQTLSRKQHLEAVVRMMDAERAVLVEKIREVQTARDAIATLINRELSENGAKETK